MNGSFSNPKNRIGRTIAWLDQKLLQPHPSIKDIALQKKSLLLSIFLLVFIYIFAGVDIAYLLTVPGYAPPWYGYVFLVGSYALNRIGKYRLAAVLTISMFPIVVFSNILEGASANPLATLYYLILSIILGSILLQKRFLILLALINSLGILLMMRYEPAYFPDIDTIVGPLSTMFIGVALVLISMVHRDQIEKSRQVELRQSEERYRTLFDGILDGVYRSTHDGKFLDVNPAMIEMFGYANKEEMLALDIKKDMYFDLKDRESASLETDQEVVEHFRMRHKDGSEIWVEDHGRYVQDKDGNVIFHEGILRDITERKRSEAVLNLRLRLFEYATNHSLSDLLQKTLDEVGELTGSPIGFYHFVEADQETLSLQAWSTRTLKEFCQAEGEGKHYPINEAGVWVECVREKQVVIHNDYASLPHRKGLPDGHAHVIRELVVPILRNNRIVAILGVGNKLQDYTDQDAEIVTYLADVAWELVERKYQEEEREKLVQELEMKNAELERFTYTVSHDLKSPLITISGFLGQLLDDIASGNTDRIEDDSRRIKNAVIKMHQLLKELLELSRIGRLMNPPEKIPFEELAHDALDIVQGQIEARGVTVSLRSNLSVVYGDRQRLTEVMQNLIDNAAKCMGEQSDPHIEIGQRGEEDGKPVFYVKDNGIGIAPEYHEKIFGLFEKLDVKTEGTGIGLALVKRIVEFHGGRIWVDSEVSEGATFYFTLNRSQDSS
jgi:PAS domain S-box-containing protein